MGTIGTEVFEISLSEMNIETVGGDEGIRNEDGFRREMNAVKIM